MAVTEKKRSISPRVFPSKEKEPTIIPVISNKTYREEEVGMWRNPSDALPLPQEEKPNYIVVKSGISSDVNKFQDLVNAQEDYRPLGGIAVTSNMSFFQAMVLK